MTDRTKDQWQIKRVKSRLWSFVLEIYCWTMLHSWVGQLKLIANKSRHWEQSRLYRAGDSQHIKISKSSTENHLHQLDYVNHFDVWVPRKLSEKKFPDRISPCDSLRKHNKNVTFLKQIVMGDEKWILYNSVEWKRSWGKWNKPPPSTPKAGLHPKKVMLCIWWNWKVVLYYELLPENQLIPTSIVPS